MSIDPQIGVVLPADGPFTVPQLVEVATTAERSGLQIVLSGEVAGNDVFTVLASTIARTHRVVVGTGVVSIYSRPPSVLAMGFAGLQGIAGPNRLIAGLGVGSPLTAESWFGTEFKEPVKRMRTYVTALGDLLSGRRSGVSEQPPTNGFQLQVPTEPMPVHVAAAGPHMLELCGELADGAIIGMTPPANIPALREHIHVGEQRAGRSPGTVVPMIVGNRVYCGERTNEARHFLKRQLLPYAVQPSHAPMFRSAFTNIDEATDAWKRNDRQRALDLMDDSVVDEQGVVGEASEVLERIRAYGEAGAQAVCVYPSGTHGSDLDGICSTIRRIGAEL